MGIKRFICLKMRGVTVTSNNIFTTTRLIISMGHTFYIYNLRLYIHINSLPWVAVVSGDLMPLSF